MTEYQDFLTEYTPRLVAFINDPATKITPPKYTPEGNVFWAAAIQSALAMGITEKKNGSQTISFMYVGGDYSFSSDDDPKMGCIIAVLLSVIKTKAPFLEPSPAGYRTYKDIFDDLTEEYIKTTDEYIKDGKPLSKEDIKKAVKKENWTHYEDRLFQIIRDSSKIDPVRTAGEDKCTYGVTYDGETIGKKHIQIYLQLIEEKGRPTIIKWNDDTVVCVDPRLREVAETAIKAFRCRMKLPEKFGIPIQNALSKYVQFTIARQRQSAE
ncbi:hypothetical protein R84B8_00821 [Treponema sp. R8-4-B8]